MQKEILELRNLIKNRNIDKAYEQAKRLNKRPSNRLHDFGNPFPLLEIPYKIIKVYGVPIDDPKCYYIKDGVEIFRKPFSMLRHSLYTNEIKISGDIGYNNEFSKYGNLLLNFSDTKGESNLELAGAQGLAFIRIRYESFGDYDPSFRDASS